MSITSGRFPPTPSLLSVLVLEVAANKHRLRRFNFDVVQITRYRFMVSVACEVRSFASMGRFMVYSEENGSGPDYW